MCECVPSSRSLFVVFFAEFCVNRVGGGCTGCTQVCTYVWNEPDLSTRKIHFRENLEKMLASEFIHIVEFRRVSECTRK